MLSEFLRSPQAIIKSRLIRLLDPGEVILSLGALISSPQEGESNGGTSLSDWQSALKALARERIL